jgi:hypothetical protein
LRQHIANIIEHLCGQAWIDPDPEDALHHLVGSFKIAHDAVVLIPISGLSDEIAAE